MKGLIRKILKESEDDLGWAQDAVKDTPYIELGKKVIVTNKGSYFPTYTKVMAELGIPGMKEFLDNYGEHWWNHVPVELRVGTTSEIMDNQQKWLYHKVPVLGIPNNGDICYIIGEPFTTKHDFIYRLYRESDGKQFIMNDYGIKFVDSNDPFLTEQEDDLGWAREIVDNADYQDVKWIRTNNGKRFKNMSDRSDLTHLYNPHPKGWSEFSGWDNWHWVNGVNLIDGRMCYITSLSATPGQEYQDSSKPHMFYFTPVEDYDQNEISFDTKRPKRGDEKRVSF